MSIVMGLDQHRAQITGEWIDTSTGEVRGRGWRRRIVRRCGIVERFAGRELEVAMEATTGWRFVVEELRRAGARVHLAKPAETAGCAGTKKRPKGDRADARHLRELLMVKRLPECWIRPSICSISARVCGCGTRWSTIAASGSSGSARCSTTTGPPPSQLIPRKAAPGSAGAVA